MVTTCCFRAFRGFYNVRANERDCTNSSQNIECIVYFLNNTLHRFFIDRNSKGQVLLDRVFKHINLIETDFFGLKFTPNDHDIVISSSSSSSPAPKTQSACVEPINGKSDTKSKIPNNQSGNNSDENPISVLNSSSTTTTSSSLPTPNSTTSKHVTIGLSSNSKNHQLSSKITNNSDSIISNVNKANNDTRQINSSNNNLSDNLTSARWLDPTKSIKKQYKTGPPYKFYFRVKFYVTDPCRLADDTTRNYLYQQLRLDIFNNRLVVPTCSAIVLASYILQSELGDYKQEFLENGYISNYRLLPNQSDDFRRSVVELLKEHKSLSPADAEHNFLQYASKNLDCYGVEIYDAQDSNKSEVKIGVSSNGIIVFNDGKKVNQFSWAKISKIMFKKKIFSIQLTGRENLCDTFLEFNLLTNHLCKSFWEECVAQHSFFRLHQPKSPPKKFFSFLNFGSKFQYNGKTEYQTMEESKKRSFSHFSRSPSKRYARNTLPIGRPSWANSDTINGTDQSTSFFPLSKVERMIKSIRQKSPDLALEVNSRYNSIESDDCRSNISDSNEINGDHDACTSTSNHKSDGPNGANGFGGDTKTLSDSINDIKQGLATRKLIEDFEKLSRKKEDETLDESRMIENMDKNRYQDILPYDSTRVLLLDSMTGDYINASFVTIPVPSKAVNRYIATQGPLASTCDDFWQMIWEQNSSLIIMVTPLVEGGRIKCHKYWPDERNEIRHGQIMVKNLHEKCKAATIDRTIQLMDVKSGEKRLTTQIQYRAWPDHEVPADCRDFLKLVNRVRKHRQLYPEDPIVVHCSAGIGRTGVLILMETAVCIMESGEPIYPIKILEEMRKQRAMLIQTSSQFQFVADAICKVYDKKKHKKKVKNNTNNNNNIINISMNNNGTITTKSG